MAGAEARVGEQLSMLENLLCTERIVRAGMNQYKIVAILRDGNVGAAGGIGLVHANAVHIDAVVGQIFVNQMSLAVVADAAEHGDVAA